MGKIAEVTAASVAAMPSIGAAPLSKFEKDLAYDLQVKDRFKDVLTASMSVRDWRGEGLDKPPACPLCKTTLAGKYLAFREKSDPKRWIRVCVNRVWCRALVSSPPVVDRTVTNDAWTRRTADLFLYVVI